MSSRREFLRNSMAAMTAPVFVPAVALGRDGRPAASERITVGAIGLGFAWNTALHVPDAQMVAVCDVQATRRDAAKRTVDNHYHNADCGTYNDFRELLDRDDIDAIYTATPDHWHALVTVAAAKLGKHVYCQKPMTHTVAEGQAVVEAVNRYGIVFQHGTQHRSGWAFDGARQLVASGRIGRLHTIRIGMPSGRRIAPQPTHPVPKGFDYDMWLGPAPWAPFTTKRCLGAHTWYFISDYCVGYIAGWGVHHLDSAQQGHGTDETGPSSVEGRAMFPTNGLYNTPVHYRVDYEYADGVKMICTDVLHHAWSKVDPAPQSEIDRIHGEAKDQRFGVLFEGTEGSVFVWRGGRLETQPASLRETVSTDDDGGRRSDSTHNHVRGWIEAIRTRRRTNAPVEVAHRSTTLCNIGAIAMQLGRKLAWNPETERFENDDEANRMLCKPMREPWTL